MKLAKILLSLALLVGAALPVAVDAGDISTLAPGQGAGSTLKDATDGQVVSEVYQRGWSYDAFLNVTPIASTSWVIDLDATADESSDYTGPFHVIVQNASTGISATAQITDGSDTITTGRGVLLSPTNDLANSRCEFVVSQGQYLHITSVDLAGSVNYTVGHLDD